MILKVYGILFTLVFAFLFLNCQGKSGQNIENEKELLVKPNVHQKSKDQSVTESKTIWKNPMLNPMGTNIARLIRAHYLVGDYKKMLQFVIVPKCYDYQEIEQLLKKSKWGYEIKVTNVEWQADNRFILTVNTSIQQTIGVEKYLGRIENDTAKLLLFPKEEKLFPFQGNESLKKQCDK
jgi:hypothetical protein